MAMPLILVVDDQAGVRLLLYEAFLDDGFEVELASGGCGGTAEAPAATSGRLERTGHVKGD